MDQRRCRGCAELPREVRADSWEQSRSGGSWQVAEREGLIPEAVSLGVLEREFPGQGREKSEPRVVLLFAEHGAWVTPGRGDDSGWEVLESVWGTAGRSWGVGAVCG